jgi:hypothetical protein
MKVIIPLLLLIAMPLQAEVFKTVTPDGEVIYSDVKTSGSKQMNVPEPQTYTPAPLPPPESDPAVSEQEAANAIYKSLVIDLPANEETIRDNQGNIELLVSSKPGLIRTDGHRIVYYLDGEPHGRRTIDTRKVFTNVDRGEHILSVAIVDTNDAVIIESQPVKVFLHRASVQHRFNPMNPNNPNKKPNTPNKAAKTTSP